MKSHIDSLNYFNISSQNIFTKERIVSVDALRGFDMLWIIGGRTVFKGLDQACNNSITNWLYSQLNHAEWLGL